MSYEVLDVYDKRFTSLHAYEDGTVLFSKAEFNVVEGEAPPAAAAGGEKQGAQGEGEKPSDADAQG